MNIIQLYKGVLLSSVVYMQPENSELYRARFKNTSVYLDAANAISRLYCLPNEPLESTNG